MFFAPCIQNLAEIFPVFGTRVHGQTLKKGVLTKKNSVNVEYNMGSKQFQHTSTKIILVGVDFMVGFYFKKGCSFTFRKEL